MERINVFFPIFQQPARLLSQAILDQNRHPFVEVLPSGNTALQANSTFALSKPVAPLKSAPLSITRLNLTPRNSAPPSFAPVRLASLRRASLRLAPLKSTPERFAPRRSAPSRLEPLRFAPTSQARARLAFRGNSKPLRSQRSHTEPARKRSTSISLKAPRVGDTRNPLTTAIDRIWFRS